MSEWVDFMNSYLNIACLACQELIDTRENKHSTTNVMPVPVPFIINDLYISILFNIKHAIEIFIKTTDNFLRGEYDNKSHDIYHLFIAMKNRIKKDNSKIIATFKKAEKSKDKLPEGLKINLPIAIENFNNIDENLYKAERLIEKYYKCHLIKDKLKNNFEIKDPDNTVFRYPDNSLQIILNYEEIGNTFIKEDIEEILRDVFEMKNIFSNIGFPVAVYRDILNFYEMN